jgi:N-acetylmuramoyl-L-alanine amidase
MQSAFLVVSALALFLSLPASAAAQSATFDADVGLDPGHSYVDVGASGAGLREFELTLDVALRVRDLLQARGYSVNLSRTDHAPLSAMSHPNSDQRVRIEQEARIAAVGRVRCYVSVHFNAHPSQGLTGTETYYNVDNHGEQSHRLASALQRQVVDLIWQAGHPTVDRGVRSDLLAGKPYGHFFSLRGPQPSALVEGLFLSNPAEAAVLRDEKFRQAIAEGYSRGISEYLAGGTLAGSAAPDRSEGGPNSRAFNTISIASTTMPLDILD